MKSRYKPVTRLSIIFILAIVLSGSILTYFSINNISNLKELTEKKVIEEQRELFARFLSALQNRIEIVTAELVNTEDQTLLIRDSLINRANDFDFIIQPFMLKNNGKFIIPNFTGIDERVEMPVFSEKFNDFFRKGETAEFAEKDLRIAKKYYQVCFNYTIGRSDSVKALNALGRVEVKLNDVEKAAARYGLIISNYFSETDENGFPYIYYVLPQLLKITNNANSEKLEQEIEFSLVKMNSGIITLNYSTAELLIHIMDWIKGSVLNRPEKLFHIYELIESLDQQLQLVNKYGDELTGLLKKSKWGNFFTAGNDFIIVNSSNGGNYEFFLINPNLKEPAGFLLDRLKLFDAIEEEDLQRGLEFDYLIEYTDDLLKSNNGQNLIYSSQLIPYFPGLLIQIKLKNEELIYDFVKRRSWIYGVASVLLIVAMVLGVVLILRDITREKTLARLRSDFISNVTHELKTPLTSIRMYAESLLMGRVKSTAIQKDYLLVVVSESERLKRMINNILEFSKIEKQKQDYHFIETRLSDILLKAINDMSYWLEEEGFKLITEIERDITVKVDPDKFHQVYTNLLSNAIKYSSDSRKISIRLFRKSDKIITEIEDEGIGIGKDNLTKIFDEFYRVDNKESGDITGTGLGLTVSREIVESHNGKILVASEIGKGSKFSVILYQQ